MNSSPAPYSPMSNTPMSYRSPIAALPPAYAAKGSIGAPGLTPTTINTLANLPAMPEGNEYPGNWPRPITATSATSGALPATSGTLPALPTCPSNATKSVTPTKAKSFADNLADSMGMSATCKKYATNKFLNDLSNVATGTNTSLSGSQHSSQEMSTQYKDPIKKVIGVSVGVLGGGVTDTTTGGGSGSTKTASGQGSEWEAEKSSTTNSLNNLTDNEKNQGSSGCGKFTDNASNIMISQHSTNCNLSQNVVESTTTVNQNMSINIIATTPPGCPAPANACQNSSQTDIVMAAARAGANDPALVATLTNIMETANTDNYTACTKAQLTACNASIDAQNATITINETVHVKSTVNITSENFTNIQQNYASTAASAAHQYIQTKLGPDALAPASNSKAVNDHVYNSIKNNVNDTVKQAISKTSITTNQNGGITISAPGVVNIEGSDITENAAATIIGSLISKSAVQDGIKAATRLINTMTSMNSSQAEAAGLGGLFAKTAAADVQMANTVAATAKVGATSGGNALSAITDGNYTLPLLNKPAKSLPGGAMVVPGVICCCCCCCCIIIIIIIMMATSAA